MTKQDYINKYYPLVVAATKDTAILPQTMISQMILESGYNLSKLATLYYNFFGIKATANYRGKVVSLTTVEYLPNRTTIVGKNKLYNTYNEAIKEGANAMTIFKVYPSVFDGFKDYVNFLQVNKRYAKVLTAKTPPEQFNELQNAGYATTSNYSKLLADVYDSIYPFLSSAANYVATNKKKTVTFLVTGFILLFYFTTDKKQKQ